MAGIPPIDNLKKYLEKISFDEYNVNQIQVSSASVFELAAEQSLRELIDSQNQNITYVSENQTDMDVTIITAPPSTPVLQAESTNVSVILKITTSNKSHSYILSKISTEKLRGKLEKES